MLWFFIALQAMAPFIHAHAGAVQLDHTGILHLHQGVTHVDTAWHVIALDDHGAEVAVATGMPVRNTQAGLAADAPLAALRALPCPAAGPCPGAGLPAPPVSRRALPDHTLPHALAPPAA